MSSVPAIYLDLSVMEKTLALLPGRQSFEDDLEDLWRTPNHQLERLRLLHRLLSFAAHRSCRVTLLSGDVHVAALGVLESHRSSARNLPVRSQVINQLISSPIVHPPPPAVVTFAYEVIADKVESFDIDRGLQARLLKFPGTNTRFLAARNWLSMTFDKQWRMWAEWHVENEAVRYSKVVQPVAARGAV
jgi:hypothetical protein